MNYMKQKNRYSSKKLEFYFGGALGAPDSLDSGKGCNRSILIQMIISLFMLYKYISQINIKYWYKMMHTQKNVHDYYKMYIIIKILDLYKNFISSSCI